MFFWRWVELDGVGGLSYVGLFELFWVLCALQSFMTLTGLYVLYNASSPLKGFMSSTEYNVHYKALCWL